MPLDKGNITVSSAPYGLSGGTFVSTANTTITGQYFCVYPLTACQVNVVFDNIADTTGNKTQSIGLAAGLPLLGLMTQVQVVSGTCIVYYK